MAITPILRRGKLRCTQAEGLARSHTARKGGVVTLNHVALPTVQALATMGTGGGTPIATPQGRPGEVLPVLPPPSRPRAPEKPRHSGESPGKPEGGWLVGREGQSGRSGSDSAGQDKDLPAQGEVTPLLCQGRRSHGAPGMGWPGRRNILGEWRQGKLWQAREELGPGGIPSAPARLTCPPPSHPDILTDGKLEPR